MFDTFQSGQELNFDAQAAHDGDHFLDRSHAATTVLRMDAAMLVLETGFRARVMSFHSAHALGARNPLPLDDLLGRAEVCAALIRAGLHCAVDESLFAALVFHYPVEARALSRLRRLKR
jgi:hypothetical protein